MDLTSYGLDFFSSYGSSFELQKKGSWLKQKLVVVFFQVLIRDCSIKMIVNSRIYIYMYI